MIRTLVALVALSSTPALAIEVDYASYGGHEYAFINAWMTWENADLACSTGGYHLAVVDDANELRFLLSVIHGGPRFNDGNDSWLMATQVGPYAGDYEPGLILRYPAAGTVASAFWMRQTTYDRHKTVCELY